MTNINAVENKISAIRKYLKILDRYKKYSVKEIETDVDIRGAVERYLYLVMQATIDLAEAALSFKQLRKPTTMRETFYILEEAGLIPLALSEKLAKMVGLRNILAHDYENLDYTIIRDILHNNISDVKEFVKIISELS